MNDGNSFLGSGNPFPMTGIAPAHNFKLQSRNRSDRFEDYPRIVRIQPGASRRISPPPTGICCKRCDQRRISPQRRCAPAHRRSERVEHRDCEHRFQPPGPDHVRRGFDRHRDQAQRTAGETGGLTSFTTSFVSAASPEDRLPSSGGRPRRVDHLGRVDHPVKFFRTNEVKL